ncbi:MAG: hypothetical protein HRU33_26790 [Rhodobacteraceae bacterium]|nr:hypothetical protein [Paracoccaceae bacterium]
MSIERQYAKQSLSALAGQDFARDFVREFDWGLWGGGIPGGAHWVGAV